MSLLRICSKGFEKLIFDSIFNVMIQQNLLSCCWSDFRPSDTSVNQFKSITHNIYLGFNPNNSLEVRVDFLDLSKAFGIVWHEGLVYKIKINGINGHALQLIESFLHNRRQSVGLNGHCSIWILIRAGMPQVSVLKPLFFFSLI